MLFAPTGPLGFCRSVRTRSPFTGGLLFTWLGTDRPGRFGLGVQEAKSEIVVVADRLGLRRGLVLPAEFFDDRLGSLRLSGRCDRFRLDVEAFQVERVVVNRRRGKPAITAEEIVGEGFPIVVRALFLKWIVHAVTLSLGIGEFKIDAG
jgi:hypothetical protein